MKIGIGCDHIGVSLKNIIKQHLQDANYEIIDYGCRSCDEVDYPDVAFKVSEAISNKELDRGILICGTGIGVAIAANKYPGIRAALCHDVYSAERAQLSNDAQIITLGAQIVGAEVAKKIVVAYLNSHWAYGSERKVNKIIEKENEFVKQSFIK